MMDHTSVVSMHVSVATVPCQCKSSTIASDMSGAGQRTRATTSGARLASSPCVTSHARG